MTIIIPLVSIKVPLLLVMLFQVYSGYMFYSLISMIPKRRFPASILFTYPGSGVLCDLKVKDVDLSTSSMALDYFIRAMYVEDQ